MSNNRNQHMYDPRPKEDNIEREENINEIRFELRSRSSALDRCSSPVSSLQIPLKRRESGCTSNSFPNFLPISKTHKPFCPTPRSSFSLQSKTNIVESDTFLPSNIPEDLLLPSLDF